MSHHDLPHNAHLSGSIGGASSSSNLTSHHSQLQHIFGNASPSIMTGSSAPNVLSNSILNTTPSNNPGQRPRRKNTKPDLGYRPAPADDASSVHHTDDGSDRHSHYRRRTSRQPNLINTIVIWLRNTSKMRYIAITKFFYRWKFNAQFVAYQQGGALAIPPSVAASTPVSLGSQSNDKRPNPPSTPTSHLLDTAAETSEPGMTPSQSAPSMMTVENSMTSSPQSALESVRQQQLVEQRTAYLQLFGENEKLVEQMETLKKTMKANERAIRQHSMKVVFVTLLRKRLLTKLRYYYDIWFNNSKIIQIMTDMKQKQIELYVGLQQVESEREYVKSLESMNSQLKMSLFLTIFFYQWKAKTAMLLLHSEREKYENQKLIVHQELAKIRKVIEQSNQLESSELKSSQLKGSAMQSSLLSIQQKLAGIMQQSKEFRHQQQQLLLQQQQQQQYHHQHTHSHTHSPQSQSQSQSHHTPNMKKTSSSSNITPGQGGGYHDDNASVITQGTRGTIVASVVSNNIPFDNNSINSSNATNSKKTGSGGKKDKHSYSRNNLNN